MPPRGRRPALRDPKTLEAFRQDWADGVPLDDMATKYGVTNSTVSRTSRRLELPPRHRHGARRDPDELERGEWRTVNGVRRWVVTEPSERPRKRRSRREGSPGRPLLLQDPEVLEQSRQEWLAGLTYESLARRFDVSRSTVHRTSRRLGLKRRGSPKIPLNLSVVRAAAEDEATEHLRSLIAGRWVTRNGVRKWVEFRTP